MAKTKLPDALSRRHLLEGKLDPARARALAEAYLEVGREVEAIDFLARAEADDVLAELANQALERGDVFLMRVASGARGEDPGPDAWRQLAEAASRHGRERDAESALRLATVED